MNGARVRLVWVSALYLFVAAAGAWVAVSEDRPGEPFGLELDMDPLSSFLYGWGTALSAPLSLLVVLVVANVLLLRRGRSDARRAAGLIAILGAGFLAGMLAEPITWEMVSEGLSDSLTTGVVIASLILPAVMIVLAFRVRQAHRITGTDS